MNYLKSSLGGIAVDRDNVVYYVTSAHNGVKIGDRFQIESYDENSKTRLKFNLGIVEDLEIGHRSKCDAAIIRQYDESEVKPVSENKSNGLAVEAYNDRELTEGATGIISGYLNQPLVVVREPRTDVNWTPESGGGTMTFEDMIVIEELVYKADEGDSGGAFLIDEFSDIDGTVISYYIGGIYKGRRAKDGKLVATRWDSVVDRFGIDYKEF